MEFNQHMKCNYLVDDNCPVDCNGECSKCSDSTCENHRDYSGYVQLSFVWEVYTCPKCSISYPSLSNSAPPKDGALCPSCYVKLMSGEY